MAGERCDDSSCGGWPVSAGGATPRALRTDLPAKRRLPGPLLGVVGGEARVEIRAVDVAGASKVRHQRLVGGPDFVRETGSGPQPEHGEDGYPDGHGHDGIQRRPGMSGGSAGDGSPLAAGGASDPRAPKHGSESGPAPDLCVRRSGWLTDRVGPVGLPDGRLPGSRSHNGRTQNR